MASPSIKKPRRRGFTLVELMVVVAILGILATIVATNIFTRVAKSQQVVAKTNIETLKSMVEAYRMDNQLRLPTTLEELLEPNENNLNQAYLEDADALIDPWGNQYMYNIMGNKFEILSLGADGMEGGEDENKDISSLGERNRGY